MLVDWPQWAVKEIQFINNRGNCAVVFLRFKNVFSRPALLFGFFTVESFRSVYFTLSVIVSKMLLVSWKGIPCCTYGTGKALLLFLGKQFQFHQTLNQVFLYCSEAVLTFS